MGIGTYTAPAAYLLVRRPASGGGAEAKEGKGREGE